MKKIILIGIIAGIVIGITSCEDVLQEEPKTIVVEQFYNTAGDLETAVNAIFNPLQSSNCFGALYTWQLEVYSGMHLIRGGSYLPLLEFNGLDNTNINRISSIWKQFYLAIRNANLVIENAPNANNASETDIAKYTAEARFMRALSYFYMIPMWGKLPLITEENYRDLNIPLSSKSNVYALIINDLIYAEQNLPDNPSVAGRPTKWAAKAVLAHVYFTRGEHNNAMTKANEVINSNKFELIGIETVEDFQKLYGANLITSSEEIFYIKYGVEYGWYFVEFLRHPSDGLYNGGGLYGLHLDTVIQSKVWNRWDRNDLRKQLYFPFEFGLGPNTMLSKKFYDTERLGNSATDFPLYRYADILLLYAEAAARVSNSPTEDAMEKLNMVHRRAYGKNPLQASAIDFQLADYSDLSSFLDLILMERGYENDFEGGKRWFDLIRLGREKTREVIKDITGKDIADKHFLWPFPSNELELNDSINDNEQNPGY
ncbi:RagB/SusD family nutrient uptake outer membrane protein [Mariniphaga sediminis]|uniref:RagB/SusD family nutrient uptake outer membrane protein n=1 Tax=Mariniphaga sediminis TaxID=1628158 RepID=UPI00356A80A3